MYDLIIKPIQDEKLINPMIVLNKKLDLIGQKVSERKQKTEDLVNQANEAIDNLAQILESEVS